MGMALRMRLVLFDREAACGARGERHLGGLAGLDPELNVVAVQVQLDKPVGGEAQPDVVALADADQPHVGGHAAVLDLDVEHDLLRGREVRPANRGDREQRQAKPSTAVIHGRASTSEIRLSVQFASYGEGMAAGSPIAYQVSRPNGSVKPATGFQAASARLSVPSASQPFQGKSLSLTVRRNIGERKPSSASEAMFSMPAENSMLKNS